jgi:hypothetical protein
LDLEGELEKTILLGVVKNFIHKIIQIIAIIITISTIIAYLFLMDVIDYYLIQ